jgi:hypothetical protein
MPKSFWKRPRSSPESGRVRPLTLLSGAMALALAIFLGFQMGNSAIADINPVHFQGAPVHPRARGAAISENRIRPQETQYAALYGWDEGRLARAEEAPEVAKRSDRTPVSEETYETSPIDTPDFRVTIHRGEEGGDSYTYEQVGPVASTDEEVDAELELQE